MEIFNGFKGILFIGDPHLGSRPPSTRLDQSFNLTVENKLKQTADISNKKKLFPIILGDLIDRNQDYQPELWNSLVESLKSFENKPALILGNHDKNHNKLTKQDVLYVLKSLDLLHIMPANGFWSRIDCINETQKQTKEFSIYLGGTQNGNQLPDSIKENFENFKKEFSEPAKENEMTLWVTHHDINFLEKQSWYNEKESENNDSKRKQKNKKDWDSMPSPFEIEGLDWLVNGHLHKTFEPVDCGQTKWSNPGNITRCKIDEKEHIPRVWEWSANKSSFENKKLKPHKLRYEKDIFRTVVHSDFDFETVDFSSTNFVAELKEDMKEVKTRDASLLKESMEELFEQQQTNKQAKEIIENIFNNVEKEIK